MEIRRREGVYDVGGVDNGWKGNRQMTKEKMEGRKGKDESRT